MKKPSIILSLIPVLLLVLIIAFGVTVFGEDLTSGPSQIALLTSAIVVILISILYLKIPWKRLEEGMLDQLAKTGSAIFILLMIGALTATWMLSGIVPTFIYYGLKLINPHIFLLVTFLLTCMVSLMSGSSWTTVGTIGVAMMSAGSILGISQGWIAGAIISGAYFGDKRSPLSDSCNLAASVANVDLYKHMNYLLYTNLPSFIISLIVFTIVGFVSAPDAVETQVQIANVTGTFNISAWFLLIPLFTIFMIYKKASPFITLFISAFMAAVVAFFAQPDIVSQIYGDITGGFNRFLYSTLKMMSTPITIETGNEMMNTLTSTRGMSGMMNTIWLILCVVAFGGVMDASGMITSITEKIVKMVRSTVSLVSSTVVTCIFCNIALSDQYMSILLPGKMFAETYKKRGYAPELLSRTLEDSGTVTSVLVPWNTCGVVQSTVLGIATLTYLPYCIFNLVSPIITIFVAAINWKIHRIPIESDNILTNNTNIITNGNKQ